MRIRGKSFSALAALVSLFMTGGVSNSGAAEKADIVPWAGEMPIRNAWLRDHLPPDTLAYVRLPHPLGFLAAPKGNSMDHALRSTANIKNLLNLQSALVENVLASLPGFEDAYLYDLAMRLRSPMEFAVSIAPAPSLLVSMNLDVDTAADLQELIEQVRFGNGSLSLLEPIDTDGFGQILGLPVPAAVHVDANTGQVLIQIGPAISADQFSQQVESLAIAQTHKMHAMEQQIDASGYGLFMWLDAKNALPAAQGFIGAETLATLQESGLDKIHAAAFGWGSANHKGRMSLILDMPGDGNRKFLPYINNRMTTTSVGEPDALFALSIPTAEEYLRIEALALAAVTDERREAWLDGKAKIEAATGITLESILGAIGPEMIGIFDEAGDYSAIRLRDQRLFDQLLQQISAVTGTKPKSRRYKRETIYQWSFSSSIDSLDEEEAAALGPLAAIVARQNEHLFWYQDGDFLYVAGIPQPLIERIDARPDTDVEAWLSDTQRFDLSHSFIGVTGTSEKLPRRLYYMYIELLQTIADLADAEFDVWSMPTASQVQIPDKGSLGFSINLGDPYLSIEMMFENNPMEAIFSGDLASIAAIGVVAGIAIPAYQDYTIRAKISQGLNNAAAAKVLVSEYYLTDGAYPGPAEAAEINAMVFVGEYTESIIVTPDTGIIVITYKEETLPDGGQLFLVPFTEGESTTWACGSTIADKHVPSACRNPPPALESGDA